MKLGAETETDNAIQGSPVSPGVVEGIVHVVLDARALPEAFRRQDLGVQAQRSVGRSRLLHAGQRSGLRYPAQLTFFGCFPNGFPDFIQLIEIGEYQPLT